MDKVHDFHVVAQTNLHGERGREQALTGTDGIVGVQDGAPDGGGGVGDVGGGSVLPDRSAATAVGGREAVVAD